ncbi:DUF4282 domain-containing protein [Paradevosia shaoguanensis]|jgi:hypothetical protein|uniref:DUF4282 domain-containing protein n=1 Tax=Paradevosia shaoguanensis TaxID=1335043 RepID=A0AA41QNN4_9HYPH|nr:DUF4282 domain-containing protein [Paradevosia shaoguanensis]KFL26666.1 hypothetical protein JP74_11235 [Devosia sp. 17-2-E-8]MBI4047647.1 DUF4282 domain-containing protein [Devosia nanyangense]QMV01215.1 DUF4282 domain-containing protein [Devosia sp. D6-9]CDP50932.1 hypothetical protein [Devosia sp. DBB001]MCF1743471.1 DUF4282 domain-containing protein [Paradevosia shaoguanensis]
MLEKLLRFDEFIFPQVTKIIYYIGLALIALFAVLGALGALFAGISQGNFGGGLIGLVGALIGGAVGVLVWRITVELWTVVFSIHDILKDIRDRKSGL